MALILTNLLGKDSIVHYVFVLHFFSWQFFLLLIPFFPNLAAIYIWVAKR